MMNAMVAFRIWGSNCQNPKMKLFCDNRAVVDVLLNGHTKDPFLSACAHSIWLIKAKYNICVKVEHIPGPHNVYADVLSRWHQFANKDSAVVKYLKSCQWWQVCTEILQPNFCI